MPPQLLLILFLPKWIPIWNIKHYIQTFFSRRLEVHVLIDGHRHASCTAAVAPPATSVRPCLPFAYSYMPTSPQLWLFDTESGAFSSREPCAPGGCGWHEYFMLGGEPEARVLWALCLIVTAAGNLENGFRGVEKMARSFIARAHLPVLFMKCVAFNQNLFEFHPCLAHEAGREVLQGLGECYFPGQFVGRWGQGRGWKRRKSEERVQKREDGASGDEIKRALQ